jgi:hypothetical protein
MIKAVLILSFVFINSNAFSLNNEDRLVVELNEQEKLNVIEKIWFNEASGTVEGLTMWNRYEAFPSIGAGHYLWFPDHQVCGLEEPIFSEVLPRFSEFFVQNLGYSAQSLPRIFMANETGVMGQSAPWCTRSQFYAEFNGPLLQELRSFLSTEYVLVAQADFQIDRLQENYLRIVNHDPVKSNEIRTRFQELVQSGRGTFELIDYINFKGEGTNPSEVTPAGNAWGLHQVLDHMDQFQGAPEEKFIQSAEFVLRRRVNDRPADQRWLRGWLNRIYRY